MADTNLKNALRQAGMTPEEFAEIVRVDPKTVQRWVAGTTTPYPRHRATIARALDLTEHELWPDHASAPTPGPHLRDREQFAGSEVTGSWAYDTDEGAPDPITVLSDADGPVEFLDNGRGIPLTAELARALAEHAAAGQRVRILTSLPTRQLEALPATSMSRSASSSIPPTRSCGPATRSCPPSTSPTRPISHHRCSNSNEPPTADSSTAS